MHTLVVHFVTTQKQKYYIFVAPAKVIPLFAAKAENKGITKGQSPIV
jgi:hypothetical protein